jgi:hypothetical protein
MIRHAKSRVIRAKHAKLSLKTDSLINPFELYNEHVGRGKRIKNKYKLVCEVRMHSWQHF